MVSRWRSNTDFYCFSNYWNFVCEDIFLIKTSKIQNILKKVDTMRIDCYNSNIINMKNQKELEKIERRRMMAEEQAKGKDKMLLLQKYLDVNLSNLKYSDEAQIIKDRWASLWRKREQLLWIKKLNNIYYPIMSVINDFMSGKITKESITKIYKELTKNI